MDIIHLGSLIPSLKMMPGIRELKDIFFNTDHIPEIRAA
jgi:hypothetical protein